jgi:hypothetical protein
VGGTETPGVDDADGEPDHVEQEVKKNHGGGEVEDPSEVFRCYSLVQDHQFTSLVDIRGMKLMTAANASKTSVLTHCTARNLTSLGSVGKSRLNTVISFPVSLTFTKSMKRTYRKHIVRRSLRVTSTKRRPGSGTPPRNHKSQQTSILGATGFSCPEIDGTCRRRSRAYFGNDGGCYEAEHEGDQITRPIPSLAMHRSEGTHDSLPVSKVTTTGNSSAKGDTNTTNKI